MLKYIVGKGEHKSSYCERKWNWQAEIKFLSVLLLLNLRILNYFFFFSCRKDLLRNGMFLLNLNKMVALLINQHSTFLETAQTCKCKSQKMFVHLVYKILKDPFKYPIVITAHVKLFFKSKNLCILGSLPFWTLVAVFKQDFKQNSFNVKC